MLCYCAVVFFLCAVLSLCWPTVNFTLYSRVLTSLENLEISGNFVNLENSGNLKCTLGIFGAHYYQRQNCRPMTLVSENIRFMQIFAGVPLGGGVKRHSALCKKYAKMTATVILYIGFSLYNCLEKTTGTQTV